MAVYWAILLVNTLVTVAPAKSPAPSIIDMIVSDTTLDNVRFFQILDPLPDLSPSIAFSLSGVHLPLVCSSGKHSRADDRYAKF